MDESTQIALILPDPAATERLAAIIAGQARAGDAILLSGDLGAGKTHFARAFINALTAALEEVPSPTFTLVQSYALPNGGAAHHFDLYRLSGPGGLAELGWDEAREGIVLVEWPDRLGPLAPADALRVTLAPGADEDSRSARIEGWEGRLA